MTLPALGEITIEVGRGPERVQCIDYHALHYAVRRAPWRPFFWVPLAAVVPDRQESKKPLASSM